MEKILKSIIRRQIPFLIGGTITGAIMIYSYDILFTIIVNSITWWAISLLWNSSGLRDQNYYSGYSAIFYYYYSDYSGLQGQNSKSFKYMTENDSNESNDSNVDDDHNK